MSLTHKGPKYNLHNKPRNLIQNLALETETPISHLPHTDRDIYRKLAAECISTLQKNNTPLHRHRKHPEAKLIRSIKKSSKIIKPRSHGPT